MSADEDEASRTVDLIAEVSSARVRRLRDEIIHAGIRKGLDSDALEQL